MSVVVAEENEISKPKKLNGRVTGHDYDPDCDCGSWTLTERTYSSSLLRVTFE
jgi:hypothetical protein